MGRVIFPLDVSKLVFFVCLVLAVDAHAGQYILSFDDAPKCDALLTGEDRTGRLIAALERGGCEQAVFYCNTQHMDQSSRYERISKYSEAGHIIANHTEAHQRLSDVSVREFTASIKNAESVLKKFPTWRRWFRFPYFNESSHDRLKHDAVKNYLRRQKYRLGYSTIETYDWYFSAKAQDAVSAGKQVDFEQLRKLYLRMIRESFRFYDDLALKVMGRSPVHVVLLHELDINAMFLSDVIAMLKREGYAPAHADDAFKDPIANGRWNNSPLSMRRIRQIAEARGYPGPVGPVWLQTEYIDKMFEQYRVISDR